MVSSPSWYKPLEKWLAPSAPVMIGLALLLAGITLYLIITKKWVLLAAWETYLVMP